MVIHMGKILRFAKRKSSFNEAFAMHRDEQIHMLLVIFIAVFGHKHKISQKLELDGIPVHNFRVDFSFKEIFRG